MDRQSRITTLSVGTIFTILSFISTQALACGESLFRVGKGVAYRAQTAPLPGNVVVVASDQAGKRLAVRLAAAGHHVDVVETADQLAATLSAGDVQVVLAPFTEREVVASQTQSTASTATYVPVALDDSEVALAAQMYDRSLAATDSFTDFLKVIHKTLKSRA